MTALVALHLAMPVDGIRVLTSAQAAITETPSGWRAELPDGRVLVVPLSLAVSEWRVEADTQPETPKAKAKR